MTMLKNHLNSRNFSLNQKMIQIYKFNINFQARLDHITINGAGNYDQKKYCPKSHMKTPQGGEKEKGSLNFVAKKKEALRIDQENLKLAKRIVNQRSTI